MSFACGWRARRFGDSEVGYAPCASPSLGDGDRFYQAAQRAASKGQCLSAPVSLDGDCDSRLIVLIPLLAGGLWLAGARIASTSSIGMVNNLQEPLAPLPKHAYLYSTVAGTRNNDGEKDSGVSRECEEESSLFSGQEKDWVGSIGDRVEISEFKSLLAVQWSWSRDMRPCCRPRLLEELVSSLCGLHSSSSQDGLDPSSWLRGLFDRTVRQTEAADSWTIPISLRQQDTLVWLELRRWIGKKRKRLCQRTDWQMGDRKRVWTEK